MEHEGKGPNDSLGLVVARLLKAACKARDDPRTLTEVWQVLHHRTQGKPIRGN